MDKISKTGNQALIVIDVQKGLFQRIRPIYDADQVLANINTLIRLARQAGIPVIFIQHSNDKTLVKGTGSWQLHPEIQPLEGEEMIHKLSPNAFTDTNLQDVLDKRSVSELIITGLLTDGCVKATTYGALELGFKVVLVSDGHSNFNKSALQTINKWNKVLGEKGAVLLETKQVRFN